MENYTENGKMILCPSCNGDNQEESRFCVYCGNGLPRKEKTFLRRRPVLSGVTGLILIGAATFFLYGGLEAGLVGKVNGEGVTRKEFDKRVDRIKRFYEGRYGYTVFLGDAGSENLNRLKAEVLDEMTTEKLLLQEAKKAGFASAPEEEVRKELDALKKTSGLSDSDLEKKMGTSIEELKAELEEGWLISQFIEKAVLMGDQANGKLLFQRWLTETKAKAKIETFVKWDSVSTAKASCCGSGGGCGGGGRAQSLDPKIEQEAKAKGLEYYEKKTQKKGDGARVTNFGCHIQIDIIQEGKVVASLTYNNGDIQEI